jgi:hypothetical protein
MMRVASGSGVRGSARPAVADGPAARVHPSRSPTTASLDRVRGGPPPPRSGPADNGAAATLPRRVHLRGDGGELRQRVQAASGRFVVRPQRVVPELLAGSRQLPSEWVQTGGDAQPAMRRRGRHQDSNHAEQTKSLHAGRARSGETQPSAFPPPPRLLIARCTSGGVRRLPIAARMPTSRRDPD